MPKPFVSMAMANKAIRAQIVGIVNISNLKIDYCFNVIAVIFKHLLHLEPFSPTPSYH